MDIYCMPVIQRHCRNVICDALRARAMIETVDQGSSGYHDLKVDSIRADVQILL